MSSFMTSTVPLALKETLETIVDDPTDGYESKAIFKKWCSESSMSDAYVEDLETGFSGLASETPEGQELSVGYVTQGVLTRYIARKFALKMIVTDEAIEDNKYDKAINGGRRLKRALWKTADIDATNMLARGWNPDYPIGDGQPLFSNAHTIPNGGSFSNIMATPMSPSRAAAIVAITQLRKLPGHDGVVEGYEGVRILCPEDQWAVWKGILDSSYAPEPGAFNEVNVIHGLLKEVVPIKYWQDTTTRWALQSDADNGFKFLWRRKPGNKSWVDNDTETVKYSISSRWARGVSDARCGIGVDA